MFLNAKLALYKVVKVSAEVSSGNELTGVVCSGSFQTQSKQRGIVDPMLSIWGQQLIVNEDTDQ